MELFKLLGTIAIEGIETAEKAIDSISDKVEKAGEKISSAGEKISSFGGGWTKTITAGVVGLGAAAMKSSMTFEDAMAKVSTIADTSEMSIGELENAILQLSDETGIASADIAENVYNAISAGQKTGDAVNFVSNATRLAKAGFAESGDALDILSTIMNAYGLEASEVTNVSDMLIQTQNKGKTTVAELSSTMGKIIPTANAYGVSLDQLCTGYALMTSNGIATAETTTYMNSMLNELGKSGTKVSDILKDKTGKSFAELIGSGASLGDILEILNQHAIDSGLSMGDLWGSAEAGKAALVLIKDGADSFNGSMKDMQNSCGSTEAAFDKMNTKSYELQKVWNEIKNTAIELGDAVFSVLMPYIQAGIEKVREFTTWFKNLDEGTQQNIVKFGLLVAAIGPLLVIFGKTITVIGNVVVAGSKLFSAIGTLINIGTSLFSGIGTIVSFVTTKLIPSIAAVNPAVLGVVAAITTLIAIGVALYKNWGEISAFASKCWTGIKEGVASAAKAVGEFFGDMGQSISKFVTDGIDNFREMKEKASERFQEMKDNVSERFQNMKDDAFEKLSDMKENVVTGFQELRDKASEKFNNLKETWGSKFEEAREKVVSEASELKEKAVEHITKFKENASEKFDNLKQSAVEKLTEIKDKGVTGFNEIKEKGGTAVEELRKSATEKFEQMGNDISEKFSNFAGNIKGTFDTAKQTIEQIVEKVKGFMNFEWKLPHIKLPHFSISGSFSLNPPSIPKIGVDWYAKAMDEPMIMNSPTAFGINRKGQIMAGGEAGSEVVSGTDTLMNMISQAVSANNNILYDVLNAILSLLSSYMPELAQKNIVLDSGELVGSLAVPMNEELGKLAYMRGRRS